MNKTFPLWQQPNYTDRFEKQSHPYRSFKKSRKQIPKTSIQMSCDKISNNPKHHSHLG